MLNGKNVSILEAILYFGVQSPKEHLLHLKEKVFNKKENSKYGKIMVRINKNLKCHTPKNLPIKTLICLSINK